MQTQSRLIVLGFIFSFLKKVRSLIILNSPRPHGRRTNFKQSKEGSRQISYQIEMVKKL